MVAPHHFLAPWQTLRTRPVLDLPPWFRVVEDTVRLPGGRVVHDFYRIEAPDYVLIAVRRDDDALLMERHFKQCLGRVILTCPAGGVEPGETPLAAARRELVEETGYFAERWTALGSFVVDGTRGICTAHLFQAEGLHPGAPPLNDDMEEMELDFLTPARVRSAIGTGEIPLLPDLAILSLTLGGLGA